MRGIKRKNIESVLLEHSEVALPWMPLELDFISLAFLRSYFSGLVCVKVRICLIIWTSCSDFPVYRYVIFGLLRECFISAHHDIGRAF